MAEESNHPKITASWYIPKRVIYGRVEGQPDLEGAAIWDNLIVSYLDEGEAPIYVIGDFTGIENFELTPNDIQGNQQYMKHENLHWLLLCSKNMSFNFNAAVLTQLAKIRVRMFENVEDAIQFLKDYDHDLDWEQANIQE